MANFLQNRDFFIGIERYDPDCQGPVMNSLSDFLLSALSGVVGNSLFLGVLILIGFLLRYLPRRRKFRRFFQKREAQPIYIILSHVRVAKGGAIGVSNATYSFANSAIPVMEAQVAQRFKGAFLSPIPGLAGQPGLLSALLISELSVEVAPSPLSSAAIPRDGTIIAVGGPSYNIASTFIEQNLNPPAYTVGAGIAFQSGAASTDPAVGFIARLEDTANDRFVFYVAGPSEEATAASLDFLLRSWPALEKRYRGRNSFSMAVRFLSAQPIQSKAEFYVP